MTAREECTPLHRSSKLSYLLWDGAGAEDGAGAGVLFDPVVVDGLVDLDAVVLSWPL